METHYFTEQYLADALRLAEYLARKGGKISEGIGYSSYFPNPPKEGAFPADEVRYLRVECPDRTYAVAFVSDDDPPAEERKYRNRSLHRLKVGEQIKACRERRGMTLKEVADLSGFRVHSLARIEEGRWDLDVGQLGIILDALAAEVHIV